jgi:hypothetical protein
VHEVATADQPFFSSFGEILESWEIQKEARTTLRTEDFFENLAQSRPSVAKELVFLKSSDFRP